MRSKEGPAKDVDEYIARFPKEVQERLQQVRTTIRAAAPELEEAIKYDIPTFVGKGNVVFFAGFKNHISIYPAPRGNKEFQKELARYAGGKGTARFPLDEPLPLDLIRRITLFRLGEDRERAEARATKTKKR
jgi:uncharacterized protein YdhG (YjbR/CyaY superfamily)